MYASPAGSETTFSFLHKPAVVEQQRDTFLLTTQGPLLHMWETLENALILFSFFSKVAKKPHRQNRQEFLFQNCGNSSPPYIYFTFVRVCCFYGQIQTSE